VIIDALAKDGDKVLPAVEGYRKITDTYPTSDRKFIKRLDVYMRERLYRLDPYHWKLKAKVEEQPSQKSSSLIQ